MTRTQPTRSILYGLSIALFVYGWLSVNIYLPILPELERIFHSTAQMAKLTVAIYLIGFSTTQLIWGPLSDRFGRRPVLLSGLAIAILGAVLAAISTDMYLFIGARFLESLGLGAAPVLARSVLTDSFDRVHIAIAMSYVAIVVAIVPAIAPIVGGYLDLVMSWPGIFYFLVLVGVVLFVLCFFCLPETNNAKDKALTAPKVVAEYLEILRNHQYLGFILSYAITFGSIVGYYAVAPFIFVKVLGYDTHEYGYLLIFNVVFYVLGASLARVLVPKLSSERTIIIAIATWVGALVLFGILDVFTTINTVSVLLPMSIVIFGSGLVSPAANAGAMSLFRDRAGASTAIVGFSIAIGGAVCNAGLSAFHITTLLELGSYIGVGTLCLIAAYWFFLRRRAGLDAGA